MQIYNWKNASETRAAVKPPEANYDRRVHYSVDPDCSVRIDYRAHVHIPQFEVYFVLVLAADVNLRHVDLHQLLHAQDCRH